MVRTLSLGLWCSRPNVKSTFKSICAHSLSPQRLCQKQAAALLAVNDFSFVELSVKGTHTHTRTHAQKRIPYLAFMSHNVVRAGLKIFPSEGEICRKKERSPENKGSCNDCCFPLFYLYVVIFFKQKMKQVKKILALKAAWLSQQGWGGFGGSASAL